MKAIADKWHVIVTTKDIVSTNIGNIFIKNEERLLNIKIATKLSFENYVSSRSKKAHAFAKILSYM